MNGVKAGESATVIGRGASFRGELRASGEVQVDGALEGLVQAEGARLTVGREARVKADIEAQEVIVMGRVEGNIRGAERVELRSTADVSGDVFTKRFAMESDAVLRGRVDPTRAGEPMERETPAPRPVVVPSARTETASGPEPLEAEFGLFGSAGRGTGSMPSALAAAARGLESQEAPGLSALNARPQVRNTGEPER